MATVAVTLANIFALSRADVAIVLAASKRPLTPPDEKDALRDAKILNGDRAIAAMLYYMYGDITSQEEKEIIMSPDFYETMSDSTTLEEGLITLAKLKETPKKEIALIPRIDIFRSCTEDYKMGPSEYAGMRGLQPKRVEAYLSTITDPNLFKYVRFFLDRTLYVPYETFYANLIISLKSFLKEIGTKPFTILLTPDKYGSEWWIFQLVVHSGLLDVAIETGRVVVAGKFNESNPKDVLIIDDCIYTGINMQAAIDNYTYNERKGVGDAKFNFHIAVPYASKLGLQAINSFATIKSSTVKTYHVIELLSIGNYPEIEELLKVVLEINTDIEIDNFLVPIYFDHKIAGSASTAESILKAVVYPLPSRDSILKAERCYRKVLEDNP